MASLTRKKFLSIQPSEIGRMKSSELRSLLSQARKLYKEQEEKFDRYSKSVFSPALDKMKEYYEDGKKSVRSMTTNQTRAELFRLQEFFESKTSTIPGARKISLEQDRRIFGVNEQTNRPLKRMTLEERTEFWAAYREFVSMEKESYIRGMGSNTIQQYLGQMIVEKRKKDFSFDMETFKELKKRVEQAKQIEDWETADYEYSNDDVLSGKRPT